MTPATVLLHMGVGNVGSEVFRQVKAHAPDLAYAGLFGKDGGVFSADGLSEAQAAAFLPTGHNPTTLEEALAELPPRSIVVDTTASDKTVSAIREALRAGHAVVMSNKKPLTGPQSAWDELHALGDERLFYETTVGAGLPIISTLRDLIKTGDTITRIQGCFSGTLGYIFSELENGVRFSEAVTTAKSNGFTEPDPRDDLSGMDVARKVLILSRLIGKELELDDIPVERLYPQTLAELSVDEFLSQLKTLDEILASRAADAQAKDEVLRYVGTVSDTEQSVKLLSVPAASDLGSLSGPDNIIVIHTKRYADNPVVIKGPGAGIEVTAAGVFSDCYKAAQQLAQENIHAAI